MNTKNLHSYAESLIDKAALARRLAREVEALPDPIGDAIGDVVLMLARHGLCVIERGALCAVGDMLTSAELEDTQGWDEAAQSVVAAVHDSLARCAA